MSTERPEGVLAVALWDADNTNRLSEMPQEVNEEMVARATRALEWARRQGWELRHVGKPSAAATCREVGCDMQFAGGKHCGCGVIDGCSVPVYVCTRCGDSDYGDNAEAVKVLAECAYHAERTS